MEDQLYKQELKTATALRYAPEFGDTSPRIVASGRGHVAEEILSIARANNIPLREDPELAGALASLDIGSTIPPELFRVVAEVIAYVYRLNGRMR